MPSPLHGASTITLSKYSGSASQSASGWAQVTAAFVTPSRSSVKPSIFALLGTISLATSRPSPCIRAAMPPLLPPGAAHRSSTLMPGFISAAAIGAMAEGS